MLVVFEGPDKTGKSTSARELASGVEPVYGLTRDIYERALSEVDTSAIATFDRLEWITQYAYRLTMPYRDWAGTTPQFPFPLPKAHLIIKCHTRQSAAQVRDEFGYPALEMQRLNLLYRVLAESLLDLNRSVCFSLFKSVSLVSVENTRGRWSESLEWLDSEPLTLVTPSDTYTTTRLVRNLRYVESASV